MYTQLPNLTLVDSPKTLPLSPQCNNSQMGDAAHCMQECESVTCHQKIYEVHLLVSIQLTNWPTRV